jgi:hypothetical protein
MQVMQVHTPRTYAVNLEDLSAQGRLARLFCFLALLLKDSHNYTPFERFQNMDPELGAVNCGAEVE